MTRPVSRVAGLVPPWAVSPLNPGGSFCHLQLHEGGQLHVDDSIVVEHHVQNRLFLQVVDGITQLIFGELILVVVLHVHDVVEASVGIEVLGGPCIHLGQGELGSVALKGALNHLAIAQVPQLQTGDGRSLLHLVSLVVHHFVGLAVHLDGYSPAQVSKVDGHANLLKHPRQKHPKDPSNAHPCYFGALLRTLAPSFSRSTTSSIRTPPHPER